MKRKSEKITQFVRGYRILQYLQKYTDEKHPIKQKEMRANAEVAKYMGRQDTYNDLIFSIAEALNCDMGERLLPEEEWRIVFDLYREKNGDRDGEDLENDDKEEDAYVVGSNGERRHKARPIKNLYYQHIFSYEEIDALIEGVWFSKTLSNDKRTAIVKKIIKHLTSKHYKDSYQGVLGIKEPVIGDRGRLEENLAVIREAMSADGGLGRKISFRFNGYNRHKKLISAGDKRHMVSPYYIVANGGRYYLIGGWDGIGDQDPQMCIYRIDLMSELNVLPERRLPNRKIVGLPYEWSDDFSLSHLNMFFDEPENIHLRIKCESYQWTFLHDWFGDNFQSVGEDYVVVKCSPKAMVHWALQYSDRVEVLQPEHVRRQVIEQIKKLNEKYKIDP